MHQEQEGGGQLQQHDKLQQEEGGGSQLQKQHGELHQEQEGGGQLIIAVCHVAAAVGLHLLALAAVHHVVAEGGKKKGTVT